ncbi:hypothetical protein ACLX1H_007814 [Fusarium chlamydosporum]
MPFSGRQCIIYVLETELKKRISFRIPKQIDAVFTPWLMKQETDIRQRVDKANLELFQPMYSFSNDFHPMLGVPYMVLGWADGVPLSWADTHPAAPERYRILRSIANASLDLIRINEKNKTASKWIRDKIKRKRKRAKAGKLPGGTVADCDHQKELIDKYLMPELDSAPHVLVHGDLSPVNIIMDEKNNVKSIIDFGLAEFLPLQFAAAYPRFLTHEPQNGEEDHGRVAMTGVPRNWNARDTLQMRRDREFYLMCIKEKAFGSEGNKLMRDYWRVLARHDEIARYWWFTAASRIDIHRDMVACDWKPPIRYNCIP